MLGCSSSLEDNSRSQIWGRISFTRPHNIKGEATAMTDGEFLNWIADRLIHQYGENPDVDFVHKLRELAKEVDAPLVERGCSNYYFHPIHWWRSGGIKVICARLGF